MKWYQVQTRFFLVFIVVSFMAFVSIPPILKSFSKANDNYVISELKRAQSEMYFYEINNGNYKNACLRGIFGFDQQLLLLETGNGVSCTVSSDFSSMSMYIDLKDGFVFCVDSFGFNDTLKKQKMNIGYCPN